MFQNGNLDLGSPFHLGAVRFFLTGCRDIETVRAKYGLGQASLVITEPGGGDIRTRYYRASVAAGEEAVTVTRLALHPEDFQYVEFDFVSIGCAANTGCATTSSATPREGPVGTSFSMRLCCWDVGARVTKSFTTPSGKTVVINDVAGADRTVPAGWGGSNTDERGTYSVFARDDNVGALVRFRVT